MTRLTKIALFLAFAIAGLAVPAGALGAEFGLEGYEVTYTNADGSPDLQAGSHPFALTTSFAIKGTPDAEGIPRREELKDATFQQIAGLIGNTTAVPECSSHDFLTPLPPLNLLEQPSCGNDTAVGTAEVSFFEAQPGKYAVYNLEPPAGDAAELGFLGLNTAITIDIGVKPGGEYNVVASIRNVPQVFQVTSSKLTLWGEPGDPAHDAERGSCITLGGSCPSGAPDVPFLTLPRSCGGPLASTYMADGWPQPGVFATGSSLTHDGATPPNPSGFNGCEGLGFSPSTSTTTTGTSAGSPTGLSFGIRVADEGLTNPTGLAQSDVGSVEVGLPEGFATNPSLAEGLAACSEADLERESPESAPGAGCPEASKIGTVDVTTPLLAEPLTGSVYVAKPFENPFDSLLALYLVIRNSERGILVKQALHVVTDEQTGRLTAVAENLPQLPFSEFKVHLREGPRSPLTTPRSCGQFGSTANLTARSGAPAVSAHSSLIVSSGANGGPCPSGNGAPLKPSFEAGTVSPLGASYSPFVLNLARAAGTEPLKSIETTLPEGLLAKLAGVTECSDAQIAAAVARSGTNEGALESASPSCPSNSQVGTVEVGAGSGSQTYVQGKAYLAGPYKGAPLSLVVITPAIAGPFDLGVVVIRNALYVDPETARVRAVSDQFPTILHGIPLDIRSISLKLDRPQFTVNPTSCDPAEVSGSATSVFSQSALVSSRFQVGGCAGLGFKPTLKLSLKGSTKHGGHPALKAVVTYPKGGTYANIARAQVNLPHSEFLEQNNLNKTCTRPVLFEGKCPKTTIYGKAKAWSPLLDQPLQGNVYLVGGFGYKLPALVAELNGQIRVVLKGKVDSGPNKGIRNTFEAVPDAPVSRFVLELKGGPKYSLLVNSENLCQKPQHAISRFTAQNGAVLQTKPLIANECGKAKRAKKKARSAGR
jgi:hypothetical protein